MNERLDDAVSFCAQTLAWIAIVLFVGAFLLSPVISLALLLKVAS